MLSKFASPSISKDIDQGKFKQLAQEPLPMCRDGAPPNVQNIHFQILEEGFDRTRPAVGICVKYLSEQGKKDNKLLPLSMRRPCMDP